MPVNSKTWLEIYASDVPEAELSQLQLDSRKVGAGDVFLAIPGVQQHGKQFIAQALTQGAALVLTNEGEYDDNRVIVLPELMQILPALVASFYQQPARKLQLVGITGTNGKSSTAFFVNQLAQQLGKRAAVIGTLGYGPCDKLTPLPNTTPHYVDIQRILADAVTDDTQLVAMEVSSHALVQQRVAGLLFDVSVFTNLTRDHLDYHGSMAEYGAAKALLFTPQLSRAAVINVSDEFGRKMAAQSQQPMWVYGKAEDCHGFSRYVAYSDVNPTADGYQLTLSSHAGEHNLYLPLLGEFNIQNVLAAIASARESVSGRYAGEFALDGTGEFAVEGLLDEFAQIKGSMQLLRQEEGFRITPDSAGELGRDFTTLAVYQSYESQRCHFVDPAGEPRVKFRYAGDATYDQKRGK